MDKRHILILGGTAEARDLAGRLAARADLDVTLSLAGRTVEPAPQPVPVRSGGFGGPGGLAAWLSGKKIDLLVDATHPFASRISANARIAAKDCAVSLLRLERAGWQPVDGDRWTRVASVEKAIAALGDAPRRVFLAIGRQEAFHADAAPQHHYLVRSVDPVEPALAVPSADYVLARGPFSTEDEIALLKAHRIEAVVSKNSGGRATYAKIEAARVLGIEVVMIERAAPSDTALAENVEDALRMIDHLLSGERKRGV
ncbi:MAG: cobalt-precorrin-6A reductase [Shinella sp.]|nr:cobalt-precorrin-6A reductase [Shinella sp.]